MIKEFIVHYWFGPNDDDVRLAGDADTIDEARAISAKCPNDETALISDCYGGEWALTA